MEQFVSFSGVVPALSDWHQLLLSSLTISGPLISCLVTCWEVTSNLIISCTRKLSELDTSHQLLCETLACQHCLLMQLPCIAPNSLKLVVYTDFTVI